MGTLTQVLRWLGMLAAISAVLGITVLGTLAWFLKHPRDDKPD